ncbi:MAG: hypothetical protein ACYC3Q_14540 [Gemmatimonadaceae bacterium]
MDDSSGSPPDARALRNHQIRKYRLVMLVVVFLAVTTLVLVRGVNEQGILLIAIAGALTAFRGWQYWAMRPRG